MKNSLYQFLNNGISFVSHKAAGIRKIYFPLCGINAESIKASISPSLSGDIKVDKKTYITMPASTESLRYPVRNFFLYTGKGKVLSFIDRSEGNKSTMEAGPLWHKVTCRFEDSGLELCSLNFIPVTGEKIELMQVTVKNISSMDITFTPTAAIPLFARALANKHDHEHVTSLLHRTQQLEQGVCVKPSMQFNEEGHSNCEDAYFVYGCDSEGNAPIGTFPTVDSFCGDGGNLIYPEAVYSNRDPVQLSEKELNGKEAVGALRFREEKLSPNEEVKYIIQIGVLKNEELSADFNKRFGAGDKISEALAANQRYWNEKTHAISFDTADTSFNAWMHWVTLQPVLRRIFGCSFLPDHDYGKGGKGWRDIWQDLLSLILIEPKEVRQTLIDNFAGVRIDGSNATIIGSKPGEFLADRNAIARVWMDHGIWPILTLLLYIDQTGDIDIMFEENSYFSDFQLSRTKKKNGGFNPKLGHQLKTKGGEVYSGSLFEHILIQLLVQFYNVGEHNVTRLESADWNDGLDMAFGRGESVAFMSQYAGNMLLLADFLEKVMDQRNMKTVGLAKEVICLLDTVNWPNINYENVEEKRSVLFDKYFNSVEPSISGEKVNVSIEKIFNDLRLKGNWVYEHVQEQEWIAVPFGAQTYSWFNGYYDNDGKQVEGDHNGTIRMTLTGQVFPIMSGLANDGEIKEIVKSVNCFLKDERLGGIRLNSDFGLRNYLSLGRAFGFAYGTKENGAFFSHMIVMYAYALYKRGFAKEGHAVIQSIYDMCVDTDKSKIFPGIPEYLDSSGRGMYHYLTGSASWLVLTELTQVFGVQADCGDLVLYPQLVKEQFKETGIAEVSCHFASKRLNVRYENKEKIDAGNYRILEVKLNENEIDFKMMGPYKAGIRRSVLENIVGDLNIVVILGH